MHRVHFALLATAALGALAAVSVLAAEPALEKRVLTEDEGTAVILIEIRAANHDIYGVTIVDESGSITDIIAPKGWAGISSGDRVVFTTTDRPIAEGRSVAFKMVTTDRGAPLGVTFRDAQSMVHSKQTI